MRHSIFTLAILAASPALADLSSDVATCAAIEGDLSRLTCFDELARAGGLEAPQAVATPVAGTGKWQVERKKNPIDDSETVVLTLLADQGVSRFGQQIALFARCQSNQTEVYVFWNSYLASDGDFNQGNFKNVLVRNGTVPAVTEKWSTSTDQQATFAPGSSVALLKAMAQSSRFVVQTTPYNESPITAVFDTTGLSVAMQPLAEVCGWLP